LRKSFLVEKSPVPENAIGASDGPACGCCVRPHIRPKEIFLMKTRLFVRVGWFCIPSSFAGFALFGLAAGFCATVFAAVDRHSHSASDTLYGVFPYVVCTFLLLDWVGRRSIEKAG
jgi:hypothetical protein